MAWPSDQSYPSRITAIPAEQIHGQLTSFQLFTICTEQHYKTSDNSRDEAVSQKSRRSVAISAMWPHARVLRTALLAVSVLTLSGVHLHHERIPDRWRVGRLVSLALSFICLLGNTGFIINSMGNGYELMYSLAMNLVNPQGILMLLLLTCHRRRLHKLLERVTALDQVTVRCRREGEYKQVLAQVTFLSAIPLVCFTFWTVSFFIFAEMKHPNYIITWYIPSELRNHDWYGVIIGSMVLSQLVINVGQMSLDVLLVGLAEAMAHLQDRMSTFCQMHLTHSVAAYILFDSPHCHNDKELPTLSDALPVDVDRKSVV